MLVQSFSGGSWPVQVITMTGMSRALPNSTGLEHGLIQKLCPKHKGLFMSGSYMSCKPTLDVLNERLKTVGGDPRRI